MYAIRSYYDAADTMHRPPPIREPMPPQEQAKGRESIMNLAVLLCGSTPTARIRGSMVTIPMAQAAASCVITSYSIHYTKLYEITWVDEMVLIPYLSILACSVGLEISKSRAAWDRLPFEIFSASSTAMAQMVSEKNSKL